MSQSVGQRFDNWFESQGPRVQWLTAASLVGGGVFAMFTALFYLIYVAVGLFIDLPPEAVYYPPVIGFFFAALPTVAERDHYTEHEFSDVWAPVPQLISNWHSRPATAGRIAEMLIRGTVAIIAAFGLMLVLQYVWQLLGLPPEEMFSTIGFVAILLVGMKPFMPPKNNTEQTKQ